MFFISWGSRGKIAEVGSAGLLHCAYCDKDSYFTRMVAYTARHIYWIFRWVTNPTSYVICGNCGAAHDDHENHRAAVSKAIPKWDRFGWLAGAGGIGAIIATGTIAAAADNASNKSYVAAPHVGDVYEIDLAQTMTKPEAPQMYTAMRVTKVDAKGVEVEIAKTYYNQWRGVDRDLDDGSANQPGYYDEHREALPAGALEKMYADGVVHDVRR